MRARVWIALSATALGLTSVGLACGSFHGTDTPAADGGSIADASNGDGGGVAEFEAGAPCSRDTPFGDPAPLFVDETILPYGPTGPRATLDELTLYFYAYPPGTAEYLDIYVASRATTTEQWGHVQPLFSVNSPKVDAFPSVDATGNTIVLESGRGDAGEAIWSASRASSLDDFVVGSGPIASTPGKNEGQPFLDVATGGVYFVSSSRTDGGAYDIVFGHLDGGALANVKPVDSVNSDREENVPVPTPDGLQLYFLSDKNADAGAFHVYVATRPTLGVGFAAPVLATDFDTRFQPTWFSTDRCRAYGVRTINGVTQMVISSRPQ